MRKIESRFLWCELKGSTIHALQFCRKDTPYKEKCEGHMEEGKQFAGRVIFFLIYFNIIIKLLEC